MSTYFVIGIIVQLIVLAERAVRFPWAWEEGYSLWEFWVFMIAFSAFNVLVWPLTIVSEIYNVANGE